LRIVSWMSVNSVSLNAGGTYITSILMLADFPGRFFPVYFFAADRMAVG
jgi:hypothetical protein